MPSPDRTFQDDHGSSEAPVALGRSASVAVGSGDNSGPTGPRTAEGKAIARINAMKHGLLAESVVVTPAEKSMDFFELYLELHRDLDPEGALEEELVDRIITMSWRLRRACRIDRELFLLALPAGGGDGSLGLAFRRDAEGPEALAKLSRYEAHLDRSRSRALHELQRIQAARKAGVSPAIPAIDVHLDLSAK